MLEVGVTEEILRKVQAAITENPSTMPGMLARKLGISEAATVNAFPETMRTFVDPGTFDTIWEAMTAWEKTTFIVQGKSAIVEVKGRLPKGKYGHGFFNLMEKDHPLGGHLMVEKLGTICFLEKPFFGMESLSVQFFDTDGDAMFAVYAGREKTTLLPSVVEGFHALKKTVTLAE